MMVSIIKYDLCPLISNTKSYMYAYIIDCHIICKFLVEKKRIDK